MYLPTCRCLQTSRHNMMVVASFSDIRASPASRIDRLLRISWFGRFNFGSSFQLTVFSCSGFHSSQDTCVESQLEEKRWIVARHASSVRNVLTSIIITGVKVRSCSTGAGESVISFAPLD